MAVDASPSPYVDAENERIVDPCIEAESIREQVLTAHATDTIREATIAEDGTAHEWRTVTKYFEDYIMSQNAAADTWESEKGVRPSTHRFTPHKARQYEGKIRGGLRFVRDHAPDALPLKTVLVTRTGWPYDCEGRPAPPVDFLTGLHRGRKAFTRALRDDVLADVPTWGRVTVREPHEEGGRRPGYPHAHDGIVVVGDVTEADIRPAVDSYVAANPFARSTDHDEATDAISVWDTDTRMAPFERLGAELTNGLVGYAFDSSGGSPLAGTTDAQLRFGSLMWTTGKQSVTFDDTFCEWIDRSQDGWTPEKTTATSASPSPSYDEAGGGPERVEPDEAAVAFEFPDGEADDE